MTTYAITHPMWGQVCPTCSFLVIVPKKCYLRCPICGEDIEYSEDFPYFVAEVLEVEQ